MENQWKMKNATAAIKEVGVMTKLKKCIIVAKLIMRKLVTKSTVIRNFGAQFNSS